MHTKYAEKSGDVEKQATPRIRPLDPRISNILVGEILVTESLSINLKNMGCRAQPHRPHHKPWTVTLTVTV